MTPGHRRISYYQGWAPFLVAQSKGINLETIYTETTIKDSAYCTHRHTHTPTRVCIYVYINYKTIKTYNYILYKTVVLKFIR